MAESKPGMTAPDAPSSADDVLSLHRGIVSRWAGGSIAGHAAVTQSLGTRSTGLLDHLAGQTSIGSAFGSDAFEIAMFMASEALLAPRLGPELRTMALGDLADLVQIALEEEDIAHNAEFAAQGGAGKRTGRAARAAGSAKIAADSLKKSGGSSKQTVATSGRRLAPAQARKLAAVRHALAAVRARAAAVGAALPAGGSVISGDSRTDAPGQLGSTDPGASWQAGPLSQAGASLPAGGVDSFVSALPGLREASRLLRASGPTRARIADPQRHVASIAELNLGRTPTRALRMAESDAEMAMLAPTHDVRWAPGSADDAVESGAAGVAQSARGAHVAFDASQDAWVRAASTPALHRQAAERVARAQVARVAIAPVTRPSAASQAQSARTAPARLAVRSDLAQPAGAAARGLASPAAQPALQRAIEAASLILQRAARSVAMHSAWRAPTDVPSTKRPFDGAPPRPPIAADDAGQRSSQLLQSGPAIGLGARWSEWFAEGDAVLSGQPASAPAFGAPSRQGYAQLDSGSGDWLSLGEHSEFGDDAILGDAQRGQPTDQRRTGDNARSVATPTWLTPSRTARSPEAQQQASAARQQLRSRDIAAVGPTASAAASAAAPSPFTVSTLRFGDTMGASGLGAWRDGVRMSERLLSGLEPVGRPSSFSLPDSFGNMRGSAPQAGWRFDAATSPGLGFVQGLTSADGTPAILGGALARDAGAGDWLQPGSDAFGAGFGEDSALVATGGEPTTGTKTAAALRASPLALRAALAQAPRPASAPPQVGLGQAHGGTRPPMTSATNAAVQTIVTRVQRHLATMGAGAGALPAADVMSFALGQAGVLGVLQHGQSDALTPMLAERAAEQMSRAGTGRRWLRGMDIGSGEMLDLGAEDLGSTKPAELASDGTGPTLATARTVKPANARQADASVAAAKARIEAAFVRAGAGSAAQRFANEILGGSEPAGLRAALSLFGEHGSVSDDLGSRFVARWIGAKEPRPSRGSYDSAEQVALQVGRSDADTKIGQSLRPTVLNGAASAIAGSGSSPRGSAVDGSDGGERTQVFEGLAGLAALRTMRGAGDVQGELLALGGVEAGAAAAASASMTAAAESASSSLASSRRQTAARTRAATAVRMHRFEPVGLGRGRQLFGRQNRALRTVSRSTRVGYGAAGLGGGALVGLGAGESESAFFGDTYAASSMVTRAERLGSAISARRSSSSGSVGHLMPAGSGPRTMVAGQGEAGAGPAVRPIFSNTSRDLVSSASIAAEVASAGQASGGATAAFKGSQASSLARVLSVTATPGGNVLPLVAPAARAVVAKAAAKPMSESIATSGSNPTLAMPIAGHNVAGGGGAGSGQGATPGDRQDAGAAPQQELDALAMKIARSVLVRIKRERERRGIHV